MRHTHKVANKVANKRLFECTQGLDETHTHKVANKVANGRLFECTQGLDETHTHTQGGEQGGEQDDCKL